MRRGKISSLDCNSREMARKIIKDGIFERFKQYVQRKGKIPSLGSNHKKIAQKIIKMESLSGGLTILPLEFRQFLSSSPSHKITGSGSLYFRILFASQPVKLGPAGLRF